MIAQDSVCQFKYDKTRYEDFVQQVQLEIMNNGPVVGVFLLQNNLDTFKPKNENGNYVQI